MTHTHAKDQSQRWLGAKVRVEKDGQMDGGNYITISHANAVGNNVFRPVMHRLL